MKKSILIMLFAFFSSCLYSQEYELGQGYHFNDMFNAGGYFSIDYAKGEKVNRARLDDVAFLVYGNLNNNLSYFVELEAAPFYQKDFDADTSKTNTQFRWERAYVNYLYSESFNLRVGKLITPIGYWNLEPINVLRDTSSNPLYSYLMFPKFVSGVDVSGFISMKNGVRYHIFGQATDDLDPNYINIRNDFFIGSTIEYEPDFETHYGANISYFETKQTPYNDRRDIFLYELNAKYDSYPFLLQTEWAYTDIDNKLLRKKDYQFGGYAQGMYNLTQKHALVTRFEYFKDTQHKTELEDTIFIMGYSYRPVYAVSLKGEYQFHSESQLDRLFISFSVMF